MNGQTSVMVSVCTCPGDWRQHRKGGQGGLFGGKGKRLEQGRLMTQVVLTFCYSKASRTKISNKKIEVPHLDREYLERFMR